MISSQQRLGARDVQAVLKHGVFLRGQSCTVRYLPATKFACAVVVSKKVHKKAVDRNTLRRKVYRALSPLLAQTVPQVEVVIMPTQAMVPYTTEEVLLRLQAIMQTISQH